MALHAALRRRRAQHPHVLSASLAAVVLVALVLSPWLYGLLTDKHTGGRWTLSTAPAPIPSGLRLTVEDDEVRGEGPCNSFRSRWSQDDGLTGDMIVSAVLCPPNIAEQEDAYFAVLTGVRDVEVDGNSMTLSGPEGQLQFVRAE